MNPRAFIRLFLIPCVLFPCVLFAWAASPALAVEAGKAAPYFEDLDVHHHPITTDSEEAQRYFDHGLVLAFGFNHGEALRSFLHAAELDPDAAMAWWGAAWVLGPNINGAMDPARVPDAWKYLQRARAAAGGVTERERAYVEALAERYGPEPLDDRSSRDAAFAQAMGEVAARFPDDLDARTIHAESLMVTTPWDYWQDDDTPKEVTETILAELHEVLRRDADHVLANHLLIHAVEAAHPERGLEEAHRLEALFSAESAGGRPAGAGHLVHMPSHIYIRVGAYHAATAANLRAIEADRHYLEAVDAQGVYPLGYVPHNYHFGWATATLEGRSELALRLAREMAESVDRDAMRERSLTTLQHYWITPLYALVRFGHWQEVLDRPEPAEDLVYPRAVRHYARGMAFVRTGDLDAARRELGRLDALRNDESLKWVTVWDINKSRHILEIASLALGGELEAAAGDFDAAVGALERAVEREDELNYDEPPTWHYPVRQSLGAVLLEAGEAERAEEIYRQDLETFPDNGWSLYGLLESLRRQGEVEEAKDVEKRFREAWRHADVVLTSSRF